MLTLSRKVLFMKSGTDDKVTQKNKRNKSRKPLRNLLLMILVLAVAIAATVTYSYKSAKASLDVSFTDEEPTVEVGGEYAAMSFVSNSVGDVEASAELLDADTVGSKSITYTVTKPLYGGLLNPSTEFTMAYDVVDSVPPLVLWSGDGTVLERGTEFDINNVIGYGDNADPKPAVTVDGSVDMNANGSYPLHVTVTDASGNNVDWDLTVTVADSLPVYSDDYPRTQFGDFTSRYSGEGRSFGIDVSVWQGDIDFKAAKAAGCEFAVIRIGYSVDGKIEIDDKFEQNLTRAKEAGIKTGLYLYSYDNTVEKARSSAAEIVSLLGGETLDLPVAFDWEDFGRFQTYEMSFNDLNEMYDAFAEELKNSGYDCMLYGSLNYLEKVWEDTDKRPVWLAHYTDQTDYEGPYMMWQASSSGRINGIDGDVDMDILYE